MPKVRVSSVWQHYDINPECENLAICRHCGSNISRGGASSNLKGTNTTNLWTHLRYKHGDQVDFIPVPLRKRPLQIKAQGKSTRVTKAKPERGSIRVAKPKIIDPQATVTGALPQKWEQYEQTDGISDDIKDIIYSEDPLCYSPMNEMDEEPRESVMIGKTTVVSTPAISASAAVASNSLKGSLDVCIERLTTVSEQLSYIVQHTQEEQNKDDDYYFALSLVPIMRQLSLNRKLYVRAKVQEMLFKETDGVTPKEE
ncbi:uncharacterized protein LOC115632366 isoform X2 [Scaptodrosophila lebanonensis]|uniref:Uncharacterized protein LOC115632366 isoform X2 n=1 Tax=Drosophila lebanonensis TaxID=7225 RepID=A0A6J2UBE2_DROLE|nr:uncharacterized protein LOC115632366 isoform X2 [Scaptodrosophila lebanonensis]